jgi:hypothetical protein
MEKRNYATKDIEDLAIGYVVRYLENNGEKPKIIKKGVDVISGEKCIEVKGCMKKETNLRITHQTVDYLEKNGKFKDFFIYYVYDMESDPKLLIFDNDTFQKNKLTETRHILQPRKIKEKTEPIQLR